MTNQSNNPTNPRHDGNKRYPRTPCGLFGLMLLVVGWACGARRSRPGLRGRVKPHPNRWCNGPGRPASGLGQNMKAASTRPLKARRSRAATSSSSCSTIPITRRIRSRPPENCLGRDIRHGGERGNADGACRLAILAEQKSGGGLFHGCRPAAAGRRRQSSTTAPAMPRKSLPSSSRLADRGQSQSGVRVRAERTASAWRRDRRHHGARQHRGPLKIIAKLEENPRHPR